MRPRSFRRIVRGVSAGVQVSPSRLSAGTQVARPAAAVAGTRAAAPAAAPAAPVVPAAAKVPSPGPGGPPAAGAPAGVPAAAAAPVAVPVAGGSGTKGKGPRGKSVSTDPLGLAIYDVPKRPMSIPVDAAG